MVISQHDARLLGALIKAGAFQKINRAQLAGNHTIAIVCGDCNHSGDILDHHRSICQHSPHLIAMNGGASLIPVHSPLTGARVRGKIIIEEVVESVTLKGIRRVVLYSHTVCGKAKAAEVTFRQSIRLHVAAKERLKRSKVIKRRLEAEKLELLCLHHVCMPDEKRKTWFIDRAKFHEFEEKTRNLPDEAIFKMFDV